MLLSPTAPSSTRSRRCWSAPTTSRPRTVARSASSTRRDLLHAVARPDRPQAVRVIVEGFFEPLIGSSRTSRWKSSIRDRIGAKLAAARDDIERYARRPDERPAGDDHGERDRARRARRLPDPRARDRRAAAGLPRLRVDLAEAARRCSTRSTTPTATTTPTSTAASTRWRRRPTRSSRARARGSPRSSAGRAAHDDLHAQRHRGDQPRRLLVGSRATLRRPATRC